jgi:hypothetical protein
MNSRRVFIISGTLLFTLVVFSLGMLAVDKNMLVWQKTSQAREIVKSLVRTGKILPPTAYFKRSEHTSNQRYQLFDETAIAPGILAINRLDSDPVGYVVELLVASGKVNHSWRIDYSMLIEGESPNTFPHATKVLADGSLLVSFDDGTALARLDQCSNPIWVRTDQTYHHII